MIEDEEGFEYPKIDEDKCIKLLYVFESLSA